MVYFNVKYVIATRRYEFFYIYAESQWKYHTFESYYTCSFGKTEAQSTSKGMKK